MSVQPRIQMLRDLVLARGYDAVMVPSNDPHQSEYPADHWKAREWLSGFTGSAGTLIVTEDHAGLWTDSRYFIQAEKELEGSGIELHKQQIAHAPEHLDWLAENLPRDGDLVVDGALFSESQITHLRNKLRSKGVTIHYQADPVGDIWDARPPLPRESVFELDLAYCGESRADKLGRIRQAMNEAEVDYHLVSTLDDIAWTLNLRGADVECNPVLIAYLLVATDRAYLFADNRKVDEALKTKLEEDGIELHPYGAIDDHLTTLSPAKTIGYPEAATSILLVDAFGQMKRKATDNIPAELKACKNETEIANIRKAMAKDGVALLRTFRWLEAQLDRGGKTDEYGLRCQLDDFRAEQGNYYGESFPAITGYAGNGAIVHYRAPEQGSAVIEAEGILLFDSGGQYLEGTTDITRTVALGEPTPKQKEANTAVLQGHIALARAQFPEGTRGVQLDVLARMPLWKMGLNYGHGTGHGVGYFNNVHEGPQGIAPQPAGRGAQVLKVGMVTSNEPGYYEAGEYGIRIENLVLCVPSKAEGFLEFETLSLFPIDQRLIDVEMLSEEEKAWLNNYHRRVKDTLQPLLESEESAWLTEKCRPIG